MVATTNHQAARRCDSAARIWKFTCRRCISTVTRFQKSGPRLVFSPRWSASISRRQLLISSSNSNGKSNSSSLSCFMDDLLPLLGSTGDSTPRGGSFRCAFERRPKLLKFLRADTILSQTFGQGEPILDLSAIIEELKSERDKIARTIAALIGSAGVSGKGATRKAARKRRGGITPAGRGRLSLAVKRRWAQRRAKNWAKNLSAKAAAPKRRGRLTPAGRKRIPNPKRDDRATLRRVDVMFKTSIDAC